MKSPLVSIIVVNWNGEAVIADCLSSLDSQTYKNIEIILVDNNSRDGSVQLVKDSFPNVQIIINATNKGFAEGNNIGAEVVKGAYVLLLNNDAFVEKHCIEVLVRKMEDDETIGVIQPKILYKGSPFYPDGVINSIGSYLTITGFPYHIGYGKKSSLAFYNKESEIYTAFGACMMIKRSVIDEIGLFDEDYFAYFEESDFCHRVLLSGYKVMYTPSATAYHRGGVSARKYGLEGVIFHAFKNRICTYIKNLEFFSLLFILPLHLIMCEVYAFVNLLFFRFSLFIAVEKAILWNILHIKKTLKKRNIIQTKFRKVSDKRIFQHVMKNPRASYYLYFSKGLQYYNDY